MSKFGTTDYNLLSTPLQVATGYARDSNKVHTTLSDLGLS